MNKVLDLISRFELFLKAKKGLRIVLLSVILFNAFLYVKTDYKKIPEIQARKDAAGFSPDKAYRFIYFYYYLNQFPLATLNGDLDYSEEGAKNEIKNRPNDLIMEYMHWSRLGESARILAYMPNALVKGSPENPSIKLFNSLLFVAGLLVLFIGFWRIKKPLFGLLLLILINCTPFFIYEVYCRDNIFGLMASSFFIVLGLNLPFLFSKSINYFKYVIVAIISGALVGFFSEFRNEVSVVIVSLLLIYILSSSIRWAPKIIYVLVVLFCFNASKTMIRYHFSLKFEQTMHLVGNHGGHIYNGPRLSGHNFWHPVFCGLGDFDTKYGYQWYDVIAYQYAIPILQKEYGMDINYSGGYITNDYYDDHRLYYKKPEELPNYEKVVKKKVIDDIKNDPVWYITIIFKRIARTLTTTIPVSYVGWLLFPLVYFLYKRKNWQDLKLILVALPLSATSIIVHSGKGTTYNSLFVYFILVIIMAQGYNFYKNKMNTGKENLIQKETEK
ncbi:hypothetical protein [Aquimarina mytili]|uniref:Uncharacterized protein n=1 Tax=Aquimarina mytili TaxID=874423 RepID=A0A936ZPH4_9FLAO|nr:hypothetical protein [Aquimarina mytili]MBL0683354.1 hypothetical protein [Aquimarina mytili]